MEVDFFPRYFFERYPLDILFSILDDSISVRALWRPQPPRSFCIFLSVEEVRSFSRSSQSFVNVCEIKNGTFHLRMFCRIIDKIGKGGYTNQLPGAYFRHTVIYFGVN